MFVAWPKLKSVICWRLFFAVRSVRVSLIYKLAGDNLARPRGLLRLQTWLIRHTGAGFTLK